MASLGDFNTAPQSKLGQPSSQTGRQASPEFMKELHAAMSNKSSSSPSPNISGRVKDAGIDLLKGAVSLSQVPLGIGDMAGLGTTKAMAKLGVQPNKAQEILDSQYTKERQKSNQEVAATKGAWNTVKATIARPDVLAGTILQSAPLMIPSAAAANAVSKVGKLAQVAAGAGVEGATTTGLLANEAEDKGIAHSQYAMPALEAGLGTAAIGMVTGGLGGDATVNLLRGAAGNKALNIAKTTASEGFEESAQSAQEKMQENRIYGKPLMEGVPEAAGAGGITGGVMGGGIAGVTKSEQGSDSSIPIVLHNPETDKPVTNTEINSAFNEFNTNIQGNHSATEVYSKAYQDSHSKLDSVINNPESSPSDVADAIFAKRYIDQGHQSKLKTEKDDEVRDREINAADPSKEDIAPDLNSMTPEDLKHTHELLYKMVSGLDPAQLDETGTNLTKRFQEVDATLKSLQEVGVEVPETTVDPITQPTETNPNSYTESTVRSFPTEEINIDNYSQNYSTANESSSSSYTGSSNNSSVESVTTPKVQDTPKVNLSTVTPTPTNKSLLSSKIGTKTFNESLKVLDDDTIKTSIEVLKERLSKVKTGHGGALANKIGILENTLVERQASKDIKVESVEQASTIPEEVLATKSTIELKSLASASSNKANPVTSEGIAKQLTSKLIDDATAIVTAKSKGITAHISNGRVKKVIDDVKTIPYTPLTQDAIKTTQAQLPMLEASKDDPLVSTAHQAVIDDISQTSTTESVAESIPPTLPEESVVPKAIENNYARLTDNQFTGESRAVLEAIKLHESIDKDASHSSYQITEADNGKEAILHFKKRLQELSNLPIEQLHELKASLTSVKAKRSLDAKRKSAGKGDYDLGNAVHPVGESFKVLKDQLEALKRGIGVHFLAKNGIQFHLMEDAVTHNFPSYINVDKTVLPRMRGLIISNPNGGTDIFINAKLVNTREALVGTVAHEVVGHFGMANLFGGKAEYRKMLAGMLKNPKLRKDILSLNRRWSSYLDHWMSKNSLLDIPEDQIYNFEGTMIPEEVAVRLADEYMAELAKAKLLDSQFIERTVGYGNRLSKGRAAKRAFRDGLLKEYMTKLKYFLREVFGKHFDKSSEKELLILISSVIDTTFENLSPDMLAHSNKAATTVFSERVGSTTMDSDVRNFADQIEASYDMWSTEADPEKVMEVNTKILGDTAKFFNAMTSGFGSQSSTILSRFYSNLKDTAMKNPVIAACTTFGNMPYADVMQAINTVAKGNMALAEKQAPAIAKVMATLNNVDNQVVFEYFTTPNADESLLQNFSNLQRNSIITAKQSINKLSKGLVELNPALGKSFAKYEDCYLHTTYFKYLNQYKGSNKTPFGAWMKKKKIHTTQEEMMLGMIRDVRFLVPETLGIISRDHTLLSLFDTISKVSSENNTHWVLNSNKLVFDNGMSLNYDDALEKIKELNGYIYTPEMNEALFSGAKQEQIDKFKQRVSKMEEFVNSIDNEFTRTLENAFQKAQADGTTRATNKDEFLQQHYTRMSDDPRNGALRNKTVRNEIFKDLESFNKAFDLKNKDNVSKFFAEGGTAERVNALWKLGMIGFNPASIVRNVFGSFTLLDLGTPTNSIKLTHKLIKELTSAINNKHSDSWKLAETYGLFGVTFSAVELQILHNEYSKPLEEAYERWKKHGDSPMESQMSFLNPVLQKLAEVSSKSQIGATKMFAFTEGLFKTVSFSDYIERWEAQNKAKYPEGAKSLAPELQKVLYSKAALHANDSLIDYSSVPGFIRTLRRLPLGSPFITFTYKALPITLKAAITNPIKFAKYAALPFLITMLAMSMNDWDDDDVDEARRKLPEFYRQSSGVAPLPFKDDSGRIQWINLDPIFPWTQWTTAARKLYEDYMMGGVAELPSSTLEALHREGGFLGGPMPQVIAAMTTGINTFTGKPIETAGASSAQHLQEDLEYMWNLSTPAWVHSSGWLANMYHTLVGEPTKDRFGDIKNTTGQTLSEITGFKAIPSTRGGETGLKAKYDSKIQELKTYNHKVASDTNLSNADKALKLAGSNERLKLVLKNMKTEFGR